MRILYIRFLRALASRLADHIHNQADKAGSEMVLYLRLVKTRHQDCDPLLKRGLMYSDVADLIGQAEDEGYTAQEGDTTILTEKGQRLIDETFHRSK
jgi:hypothetical protein